MIATTPTALTAGVLTAGLLLAGCGPTARQSALTKRFVKAATSDSEAAAASFDAPGPKQDAQVIASRLRELGEQTKPNPRQSTGASLESLDEELGAALIALRARPSAESHQRVADDYARLGVLDAAHTHYRAAIAIDPEYAAAYDGLARVWRDAGLPALALGDAHRAAYFAPHSPEAQNTLGTVLQALGQPAPAMNAYERARALAPGAAYALNNLGYLSLLEGNAEAAIAYCRSAIAADPTLTAARHNLALAYAAAGRLDLARDALRAAGSAARAAYNEGIINLSLGRIADARAAFTAACGARGAPADACSRARALKSSRPEPVGGSE